MLTETADAGGALLARRLGMPELLGDLEPPAPQSLSSDMLRAAVVAGVGGSAIDWLSSVEPGELTEAERVEWAAAWDRQLAHVTARRLAAMHAVMTVTPEPDWESLDRRDAAEAELAPALSISRTAAGNDLCLAGELAGRLSPTAAALDAGQLGVRHMRVLSEELANCDDDVALTVQAEVLPRAICGLTPVRLRQLVRKVLLRLDADAVRRRKELAAAERAVAFRPLGDDMAELVWHSTVDEIALAKAILGRLAARPDGPDDERTADQRRSDALFALVLSAAEDPLLPELPGRRGWRADVTVSYETLAGLADYPGDVAGFGPVTAELARRMSADAALRFLVYSEETGRLLDYDPGGWTPVRPGAAPRGRGATGLADRPDTYRPSVSLQRHTHAKHPRCSAPGCDQLAVDHDHTVAFSRGGRTIPINQAPLCERHHLLKTHGGWRVEPDGGGGWWWTTRAGIRYHEPPHDLRPDR